MSTSEEPLVYKMTAMNILFPVIADVFWGALNRFLLFTIISITHYKSYT